MLRILYLGMQWDYGKPEQGPSYEEMSFHAALRAHPDVDVTHFDYVDLDGAVGRVEMNRQLADVAQAGAFDMLFCVMFKGELSSAVLKEISRRGIVTVGWGCDDHWRYDSFSRVWAPHFDWWTTTAWSAVERFREQGYDTVIKSQWAVEPTTFFPVECDKDIDVSFVGLPHGNRPQVIAALRDAGIDVQVFGRGWDGLRSRLSHQQMLEVVSRSKLCLNLSNSSTMEESQIKGRVFEVPACKSVLLTDKADDLESYYEPGRDIAVYEDDRDLVPRIQHLLATDHEREAIALAGYERTLREHTWKHRFDAIFEAVGLS